MASEIQIPVIKKIYSMLPLPLGRPKIINKRHIISDSINMLFFLTQN